MVPVLIYIHTQTHTHPGTGILKLTVTQGWQPCFKCEAVVI